MSPPASDEDISVTLHQASTEFIGVLWSRSYCDAYHYNRPSHTSNSVKFSYVVLVVLIYLFADFRVFVGTGEVFPLQRP